MVINSKSLSTTLYGLENEVTYNIKVIAEGQGPRPLTTPIASITLPRWSGFQPRDIGLLINDNDPDSRAIGEYYQQRRYIPLRNVIRVNITKKAEITVDEFAKWKAIVDSRLPETVQALAIAWTIPYRVACNSITSAFASGYMDGPCKSNTCSWANSSSYFNSNSTKPFSDFKMRPAMMLAAKSVDQAKAMIDRGIASDRTYPVGSAYIMNTTDKVRSLRANVFPQKSLGAVLSPNVNIQITNANSISNTKDALFYFQGLAVVSQIATNVFPPGAVADHLTSYGGMLTDSSQMSALEFTAAGATGTFGTVSEPCAYAQKFPSPTNVITFYTNGDSLIEAYWKSILQTFQGLFVGEPLANPWKKQLSK